MKIFPSKTLIGLLALVLGLFFVTSCKHKTNLAGNWTYNGQACQIIQDGNNLTFINERGDKSNGHFEDDTHVVATDWEGGLVGTLKNNKTRIDWHNATAWIREK
jgi:hypothetical protein